MAIVKKSMKKAAPKKAMAKKMMKAPSMGGSNPMMKMGGKVSKVDVKKYKSGGSVDSYTEYKMGGAVAKSGATMKKQAAVAIAMKKDGVTPKKKMQYGGKAASMKPTMKMGGKCKNGC